YTLSGALDPTFNGTGKRVTAVSTGYDECRAMVLQAGKIVAGGFAITATTNSDFALVRYDTDGTLDTSFDGDGIKTQDIADRDASLQHLAIPPDGRIVAVGNAHTSASQVGLAIARYDVNGGLDPTFGSNGKQIDSMDGGATAVAVQSDGKIVVAGTNNGH